MCPVQVPRWSIFLFWSQSDGALLGICAPGDSGAAHAPRQGAAMAAKLMSSSSVLCAGPGVVGARAIGSCGAGPNVAR